MSAGRAPFDGVPFSLDGETPISPDEARRIGDAMETDRWRTLLGCRCGTRPQRVERLASKAFLRMVSHRAFATWHDADLKAAIDDAFEFAEAFIAAADRRRE